jgi:hypothetical protein
MATRIRIRNSVPKYGSEPCFDKRFEGMSQKIRCFIYLCLIGRYLLDNKFFPTATVSIVQVGSGSGRFVINWPPGSVLQAYGSTDPDQKEIQRCRAFTFFLS